MNREALAKVYAQFEGLCDLIYDICDEYALGDPRDIERMENIARMTDEAHVQLHELIYDFDLSPTPGTALRPRR